MRYYVGFGLEVHKTNGLFIAEEKKKTEGVSRYVREKNYDENDNTQLGRI